MIEYLVALFRHMLLHEKDKPYSCHFESCGERFAKHSQLRRHLCDHTGEAPYACTESPGCSKTFHFPAQLRRHIDSVHKSMYSAPYMSLKNKKADATLCSFRGVEVRLWGRKLYRQFRKPPRIGGTCKRKS